MNKKWAVKRLTINLATSEMEKLEKYCQKTGRPATDVIRELIRSLEVDQLNATAQQGSSAEKFDQPLLECANLS
ncbi:MULTISPECIES: CopG family transcriptional regulator [Nostocales]|uniref:CopG family transcriptional regulator n=1 Tax=Nostocales TaxID=1161 RepID=UPI00168464A4|nr:MULTISPECIES: CopG family transcriptional regulator [Nostocales]MBD2303863.1 CopG family transcriptional regulator [Nostoc sp. FACHB-190]MBD2491942.1 CopG family transcriptional regulator [Aulosira sp. FACHB-615]